MSATAEPRRPSRPPVRRPVAVLMSRFPLLTETFILREVIELERQGQPVRLVPLLRERPGVIHPEARRWIERALYTPFLSAAIVAANVRALRRNPRRFVTLVATLSAGALRSPGMLARTLALFPKAVFLGERLTAEGVAHLHAHFATHPASVAMIASTLFDLDFSFTVHAHDIFVDRTLLGPKLERARFVRCISRFNRRYLAERYPEASDRLEVVHVGIDPDRYDGSTPESPTVLVVAALKPYKGLDVLVEACGLLRQQGTEFRCQIVGEGPLRRRLQRRIGEAGLEERVCLVGGLPQDEVARRMATAAVVALPSVVAADGQMEGIPVVLMEALAARRPVVASRLSGIPELIEDGRTGLLVPPGDAPALAAAIRRLLADRQLARRLGAAGRRRVISEFHLERTTGELLELLDRDNEALPEEVAELAAAATALPAVEALGLRSLRCGPDSRVAEVLVAGEERREVVVKEQRARSGQSAPPSERARREAEALERLGQTFASRPGLGVPAVLAADVETARLVLSRCRGQRLDRRLRETRLRGRARWSETVSAVRRTGVWLRVFQRQLAAAGSPSEVVVHGDFWPGNVFVTPESVEVVDFEGVSTGDRWLDPAAFLLHTELFFPLPLLHLRYRQLERTFLVAYLDGGEADWQSLRCARAELARQRLVRHRHESGAGGWLRRRLLRWRASESDR